MTPEQQAAIVQAQIDQWWQDAVERSDDDELINRLHFIGVNGVMRDKTDATAVRFACMMVATELGVRKLRTHL